MMLQSPTQRTLLALAVGVCVGLMIGAVLSGCGLPAHEPAPVAACTGGPAARQSTYAAKGDHGDGVAVATAPAPAPIDATQQPHQHRSQEGLSAAAADTTSGTNPWAVHCNTTFDLAAIRARYADLMTTAQGRELFSRQSLHEQVRHLRATTQFLRSESLRECWSSVRRHRSAGGGGDLGAGRRSFFYDLGSRKLDQTTTFLNLYPGAAQYDIVCFEPNPKFNPVYAAAAARNPRIQHVNAAVGIVPDSLQLSDRHVGSSIINEQQQQQQQQRQQQQQQPSGNAARAPPIGVQTVKVVPLLSAIVGEYDAATGRWDTTTGHRRPQSFRDRVIVKMDVEKAEFAILHHMVRSGALTLVSELLLECHYNTNLPRPQRDAAVHIGADDCAQLVVDLREASGGAMEVVLWNSVRTARASGLGYIERHGGFYPT